MGRLHALVAVPDQSAGTEAAGEADAVSDGRAGVAAGPEVGTSGLARVVEAVVVHQAARALGG